MLSIRSKAFPIEEKVPRRSEILMRISKGIEKVRELAHAES